MPRKKVKVNGVVCIVTTEGEILDETGKEIEYTIRQGFKTAVFNGKRYTVQKVMMLAFVGKPQNESWIIRHVDGDKLNNDLDNLEYYSRNPSWFKRDHYKQSWQVGGDIKRKVYDDYNKGIKTLELSQKYYLKRFVICQIIEEFQRIEENNRNTSW